jgi:hypothetical protein
MLKFARIRQRILGDRNPFSRAGKFNIVVNLSQPSFFGGLRPYTKYRTQSTNTCGVEEYNYATKIIYKSKEYSTIEKERKNWLLTNKLVKLNAQRNKVPKTIKANL